MKSNLVWFYVERDEEDGSTAPISSFMLEEWTKQEELMKQEMGVLLASRKSNMG